jgi:hypothetical protein
MEVGADASCLSMYSAEARALKRKTPEAMAPGVLVE